MRTGFLCISLAIVSAGCGKSSADTTPPDGGGEGSGAAAPLSEEEEYGPSSPILVSDPTEDITRSETIGTAVETTGSLGPDEVDALVGKHMDAVGACYQAALDRTRNQDLEGVVVINFSIGPDGSVAQAEPGESSLGDDQAGPCIADAVRTWKFPKPPDGAEVKVRFPFALRPY